MLAGMETPPRRRWLRFSLRGLLVVVTALAVWLGWNVYVVRERKAALAELRKFRELGVNIYTNLANCMEDEKMRPTESSICGRRRQEHSRYGWNRKTFLCRGVVDIGWVSAG